MPAVGSFRKRTFRHAARVFLSFYEEDVKIVTAPGLGGCPYMGRWWKMAFLPPENEPLPLRFRSSSAHDLTSSLSFRYFQL